MEMVIPGPSCSKKSTALTSTEQSRLRRQAIYSSKALHLDMTEKDRERKKLKTVEVAKMREQNLEEAEKYWEKENVKKCKQQHANKVVKEAGIEKLNPTDEKKD